MSQDGAAGWRRRIEITRSSRSLRKEVGMVFQQFNLFPHKTARRERRDGTSTSCGICSKDEAEGTLSSC